MAENREAKTSGKDNQMIKFRFVTTVFEYELHDLLRNDYESFIKVRSYENGKTKRPGIPD